MKNRFYELEFKVYSIKSYLKDFRIFIKNKKFFKYLIENKLNNKIYYISKYMNSRIIIYNSDKYEAKKIIEQSLNFFLLKEKIKSIYK